jgi:hypothetical protein
MIQRQCKKHGLVKFYKSSLTADVWKCSKCNNERVAEKRRDNKRQLIFAFGGKCQRCSYDRCIGALEFHHRDSSQKEFNVGSGNTKSLAKLMIEAAKCDLICSNCHKEEHYKSE